MIIVIVQLGAVKIYVAAVEALRQKERHDETHFTTKIGEKSSLTPSYFACEIFIPSYAKTDQSHPLIAGLYGYLYR